MSAEAFPTCSYLDAVLRFLDTISYNDTDYTREERLNNLHHVYTATAKHFAQPIQQKTINTSAKKLQASIQTVVALVVYSWSKVPPKVMIDLSIHYTYIHILDDSKDDLDSSMKTFYQDLLLGKAQQHPWWRVVNAHFPTVLEHYGPFCSLTLVRSTVDFFQGCWIEQHNFQGYPGSYDYPKFLRRLNGLGQFVGASLFPKALFDEERHFAEITSVIAQVENWMAFVNDLLSFYKEFDEPHDQTSLVNNYVRCHNLTIRQALDKLTQDCILGSQQLMTVFKAKDEKLVDTLLAFCQGYVTWHLCDPRYRLRELWKNAGDDFTGGRFFTYQQDAAEVGEIAPALWAHPLVKELAGHTASSELTPPSTPPIDDSPQLPPFLPNPCFDNDLRLDSHVATVVGGSS